MKNLNLDCASDVRELSSLIWHGRMRKADRIEKQETARKSGVEFEGNMITLADILWSQADLARADGMVCEIDALVKLASINRGAAPRLRTPLEKAEIKRTKAEAAVLRAQRDESMALRETLMEAWATEA